ncbi:DUF3301 domain-containing protein [Pseudomonas cavernae]|uniref:DUF3301 domain-containing protein n=1 Tax=Pseudomonas cavernae TaxID=2320867 RepID=A0A385Z6R3_9PSED|nr:DUF3301 domain-containing protein [Pseudomonas cavernae]AYC34945.1 DUF3301 domain-containing protein [Pseudomonas cavernae]
MIGLGDVFLFLLFAAGLAWLWRGHGIRERALALAKQHCAKLDIELLDGNVALRRLAMVRDARGHRRLARIYGFEFTVTGEQRLSGSLSMFGRQLGRIELDAFPIATPDEPPVATQQPAAKVIQLQDWKRRHDRLDT